MAGRANIGATLTLNNGNFFTNMKSAVTASKKLYTSLNGTTGGLKKMGTQSDKAGASMSSLVKKAAGVAAAYIGVRQAVNFGRDIVKTGVDFEQGMAEVQAISGATGSAFQTLKDKAKEMGAITKFSALESAEAMKYMGMAGWNAGQMVDGIAGIMNLAAASGEELGSVSDIVTDSLTAFGLKASDSTYFADILAVAASKSNTNVAMLGESFKNCAPTAGAMGYNVQDVTAALGLMANAGVKGGEAGTSLNSVMTRLAKPTKDVSTALKDLNISAVNSDGSMKPLAVLLPELQSRFSSLTEAQRGQYATMIAGKHAMSGFLTLVNASPQDFESLTTSIANSSGAAQNMADIMNDTVAGKLKLLESQFEGVKLAMFDALGSSQFKNLIQMTSDGLASLTPSISGLVVGIGSGLFGAFNLISGVASSVFTRVSAVIDSSRPAIENLVTAFGNVKDSIVSAFSGDTQSAITGIASTVVPMLANALAGVLNIASGIVNFFSSNWGVIAPVIGGVTAAVVTYKAAVAAANIIEGIRNGLIAFNATMLGVQATAFAPLTTATIAHIAVTNLAAIATSAFGAVLSFVTLPIGIVVIAVGALIAIGIALWKNWDWIKAKALELWNKVTEVFTNLKNTVTEKVTAITSSVKEEWENIKTAASEKWNAVKGAVGTALDAAKTVAAEKLSNIKNAYAEHGGGLKGAAAAAMEGVKSYYTAGYDYIDKITGGKLSSVVNGVSERLAPLKEKVSGAFHSAWSFIKDSYNEGQLKPVVDQIAGTFTTVKTAVAEKFNGVKETVTEKLAPLYEAAVSVKDRVVQGFTGIKESITGKFAGLKEAFAPVQEGISASMNGLRSVFVTVFQGIKSVVHTVTDGIKTFFINSWLLIKATFQNIVNGIKQNFINFGTSIKTAFDGVVNGIKTIFSGIVGIVKNVFGVIVGLFAFNGETIKNSLQGIGQSFLTVFDGAKQIVLGVWNAITSFGSLAFENIRTIVSGVISGVKAQFENVRNTVSTVFTSVKDTVSTVFENIKSKIAGVMDTVKNTVRTAIDTIKGFFKFDWKLPDIKLPHLKVTGSWSFNPPSVPSFGIDWYAKGGILTRPTLFGMNGSRGMAGGEAGAEAVLPLSMLWKQLRQFLLEAQGRQTQSGKTGTANNNTFYITIQTGESLSGQLEETVRQVKIILRNI